MTTTDPIGFFTGGEWVRRSKGARIAVRDPSTGERFGSVPRGDAGDMRAAIHAARWAFDEGEWPRISPAGRSTFLYSLGVELSIRRSSLVEIAIGEGGATSRTAEKLLVGAPLEAIGWYAARAARDPEARLPDSDGARPASSLLVREPAGVAGAILASAEPLACIVHKAVAALAAGNTVVLKAPSGAPLAAFVFAEACEAAGFPPGSVNVVSGGARDVGAEIATNPMVDLVSVAGTRATARAVAARAASTLKTCVATPGAGGATLILRGADVEAAAAAIAAAWLSHAGQAWGAACRIVAERSIYDEVVDAMARVAKGAVVGDPRKPDTEIGPLRSSASVDRLISLQAEALSEGGSLVAGEAVPSGMFVSPAVIREVDPSSRIAREEVSGPVLAIVPAQDRSEAIRIANSGGDAVVTHVWGSDRADALEAARLIRCGTVLAQGGGENPWAPFGGYGRGGLGREGGLAGLDYLSELKHISTPPA